MRSILITGGAGFVGRHFAEYFLKQGDEVWVVDSLFPGTGAQHPNDWYFNPSKYDNFKFFHKDCRDFFKENKYTKFDLILHLAAIVGGRLMIEQNPLAVADDLSIDSAFWQWAVEAKPDKVITFSSSAAYPIRWQTKKEHFPLKETLISFNKESKSVGIPDMSYGWSKLTTEYLGQLAFKKHGILSVVYRPFSGYGNDQDMTYPFPAILKRVYEAKDGDEIVVWGSGKQMRDFIHIDDCVAGVIKTMDIINDGSAINLCTMTGTSFEALIILAALTLGKKIKIKALKEYPEGVFARIGDNTKLKKLGFNYKIPLQKGIEKFYEVYRNNNH